MEIFINGESVSYTLEGEKNLFDIFLSLKKTIDASDAIITALLLNGNNISLDEKNLKLITLEEITHLEIEAQHKSLVCVQKLESIHEYINIIVRIAHHAASESDRQESVLTYNIHEEDIQHIAQNMDLLCKSDDLEYSAVRYLFLYACKMLGLIQRKELDAITPSQEAIDILKNILTFLSQYIFTAQNNATSAVSSNKLMITYIPQLIKVAHLLTTGDEKYAFHYFIASVDFMSMWLVLTKRVCDNAEGIKEAEVALQWPDAHKQFADVLENLLKDLSNAFEAQDWIAVNDIIEYEIVPKIKEHAVSMQEHY